MKYAIVFITTRMMNNLYQKPYILIICISIYLYDYFLVNGSKAIHTIEYVFECDRDECIEIETELLYTIIITNIHRETKCIYDFTKSFHVTEVL